MRGEPRSPPSWLRLALGAAPPGLLPAAVRPEPRATFCTTTRVPLVESRGIVRLSSAWCQPEPKDLLHEWVTPPSPFAGSRCGAGAPGRAARLRIAITRP